MSVSSVIWMDGVLRMSLINILLGITLLALIGLMLMVFWAKWRRRNMLGAGYRFGKNARLLNLSLGSGAVVLAWLPLVLEGFGFKVAGSLLKNGGGELIFYNAFLVIVALSVVTPALLDCVYVEGEKVSYFPAFGRRRTFCFRDVRDLSLMKGLNFVGVAIRLNSGVCNIPVAIDAEFWRRLLTACPSAGVSDWVKRSLKVKAWETGCG